MKSAPVGKALVKHGHKKGEPFTHKIKGYLECLCGEEDCYSYDPFDIGKDKMRRLRLGLPAMEEQEEL